MDDGMAGMSPPTSTNQAMNMDHDMGQHVGSSYTQMHMTFFWGKNAEILFSGWPGTRTGMYVLALFLVFFLSFLLEWLSCRFLSPTAKGFTRTLLHGIRVGLSFIVMLAVMSFNVGVLLVAIVGHTFGYFIFGSGLVFKSLKGQPTTSLPPCGC